MPIANTFFVIACPEELTSDPRGLMVLINPQGALNGSATSDLGGAVLPMQDVGAKLAARGNYCRKNPASTNT